MGEPLAARLRGLVTSTGVADDLERKETAHQRYAAKTLESVVSGASAAAVSLTFDPGSPALLKMYLGYPAGEDWQARTKHGGGGYQRDGAGCPRGFPISAPLKSGYSELLEKARRCAQL